MWNVLSSIGPGARAWNQVSFDGRALLAGGATGGGRYSNDFWALESDVWREVIPHDGTQEPVSREHHSFVHCPKDGKHYFWQGHMGTLANKWATSEQRRKIWRINGASWEFTGGILPVSNGLEDVRGELLVPPIRRLPIRWRCEPRSDGDLFAPALRYAASETRNDRQSI